MKKCHHPASGLSIYSLSADASNLTASVLCNRCGYVLRLPSQWQWPSQALLSDKKLATLAGRALRLGSR